MLGNALTLRHAREGGHLLAGCGTPINMRCSSPHGQPTVTPDVCAYNQSKYMEPAVYILASKKNGVLYIGVTSELKRRVWEHREGIGAVFTRKYHVHRLVYYEPHPNMESAIVREKRLKKWERAWKVRLIEAMNPQWRDLYDLL